MSTYAHRLFVGRRASHALKLGEAHAPLTSLIARTIRERILDGTLAPGDRLVEARLSEEFGVSRVPVREALRALAADGMVTIEPRRGASVTTYSPELIRELVEVRATLEALNAKLAARRNAAGADRTPPADRLPGR